jgi:23S rRNA (uracil1939-C5)-methyltransferase
MARKRKQLPLIENVLITDVAAEGKAIAKVDGMAVFVPYAVPGDVVDIQLTRKKSSFAEGKVVRFESYSENRAVPFCEHFGVCGGCNQHCCSCQNQENCLNTLKHISEQIFFFRRVTIINFVLFPLFNCKQ